MGGGSDDGVPSSMSKRTAFVTVGTTSFDKLVMAADTSHLKQELWNKGYTHLVIQMGRGSYIPQKSGGEDDSLVVGYFTFSPSIADHLKAASLVISHARSGSIFETLRLGKPLRVVVNEDLMDNRQIELAEELAERKHLFRARPQTLSETIANMDAESLPPYVPGDATPVVKHINSLLAKKEKVGCWISTASRTDSLPSFLLLRLCKNFDLAKISFAPNGSKMVYDEYSVLFQLGQGGDSL